jgi:hypothetical protein
LSNVLTNIEKSQRGQHGKQPFDKNNIYIQERETSH